MRISKQWYVIQQTPVVHLLWARHYSRPRGHSSEQNSKKLRPPFAYIRVEETQQIKSKTKFQGMRTWNSGHGIKEVET